MSTVISQLSEHRLGRTNTETICEREPEVLGEHLLAQITSVPP